MLVLIFFFRDVLCCFEVGCSLYYGRIDGLLLMVMHNQRLFGPRGSWLFRRRLKIKWNDRFRVEYTQEKGSDHKLKWMCWNEPSSRKLWNLLKSKCALSTLTYQLMIKSQKMVAEGNLFDHLLSLMSWYPD